jgi:transcription elongation factor GreA
VGKIPITAEGYIALEEELKILKHERRPNVIKAIAEAREHGDLSENAEYHAAREEQSFIEGRIIEIESYLQRSDIIDPKSFVGSDVVKFSATVELLDEDTEENKVFQTLNFYNTSLNKALLFPCCVILSIFGKVTVLSRFCYSLDDIWSSLVL